MHLNIKKRLVALFVHMTLSVVVIGLFLIGIFFLWYPNGLYLAGAVQGLIILILVDVVLGPVLTFIVYDESKKELKYDLGMIVALQLGCLAYGATQIINERPTHQILSSSQLEIFTASEIHEYLPNEPTPLFKKPSFSILDVTNDAAKNELAAMVHSATSSTPHSLQLDKLLSNGELSKAKFEERIRLTREHLNESQLSQLKKIEAANNKNNCSWVPLKSKHLNNYFACIELSKGIVSISNIE